MQINQHWESQALRQAFKICNPVQLSAILISVIIIRLHRWGHWATKSSAPWPKSLNGWEAVLGPKSQSLAIEISTPEPAFLTAMCRAFISVTSLNSHRQSWVLLSPLTDEETEAQKWWSVPGEGQRWGSKTRLQAALLLLPRPIWETRPEIRMGLPLLHLGLYVQVGPGREFGKRKEWTKCVRRQASCKYVVHLLWPLGWVSGYRQGVGEGHWS